MHPLNNGSQATERPAKKPLSGPAGWFTESGDDNAPSYPGQDWFNNNIAEFQAALAEMGVVFDPENDDHLAKAFRAINQRLGAKTMGVINVSEIINNSPEFILPITPELGPYVTLAGHGAANFTITGFGDECPVGYTFSLLIPRTIANTGGSANSLGNYVQFAHSASGDGIDLSINRRQSGASTLYTYQAYPNATDGSGRLCALYEELTFVHAGSGRWRLVKLPDAFESLSGPVESLTRHSSGHQSAYAQKATSGGTTIAVGGLYSTVDNDWIFLAKFTDRATVTTSCVTGSQSAWGIRGNAGSASDTTYTWRMMSTISGADTIVTGLKAEGRWKPNV